MKSYHIFYFPFKWENCTRKDLLFSEQIDLSAIPMNPFTNWVRNPEVIDYNEAENLYNEKNFFYEFVHPVLYDNNQKRSILYHYERIEPQQREVSYIIVAKGHTFVLKIEAINLNLYSTGVGMLTFYLRNELKSQQQPEDILTINQYGRRIFPPFFSDIKNKYETADILQIQGLNGDPLLYREDFSSYTIHKKTWEPACFIFNLIADLSESLQILPVIDDRMFVNCWYANNELTDFFSRDENSLEQFYLNENETKNFWYKYLYIDVNVPSCKNESMRRHLLSRQTYIRWQKDGMLYGVSRYSFVFISKIDSFQMNVLAVYMRTVYSRMIELILIQNASRLRFSDEIARLSASYEDKKMNKVLMGRISSIQKEYIRFMNQVHFFEVTSEEQGIELYDLLYSTVRIEKHIKELEMEIAELNQFVSLLDDKIRNKNGEMLNYIAAAFLPASFIFSLFSLSTNNWGISVLWICLLGLLFSSIMLTILLIIKNKL